ncbi:jg27108 [Pararge aegeria aegeria]|uniref:Jg27108 protein n=1 Tax=Pararge aegeria aegeria TaxID=348720 RepID=A0A8S4QP69_9NEOP|nr:jg27108 [Pararge aegeria aegeria]
MCQKNKIQFHFKIPRAPLHFPNEQLASALWLPYITLSPQRAGTHVWCLPKGVAMRTCAASTCGLLRSARMSAHSSPYRMVSRLALQQTGLGETSY